MVGAAKDASGVWVDVDVVDLGVVGASDMSLKGDIVVGGGYVPQGWRAWHMQSGLQVQLRTGWCFHVSGLSPVYAGGYCQVLPDRRTRRVVRLCDRLGGCCRLVLASWLYVLSGGFEGGRLPANCGTVRSVFLLFCYICFPLPC